MPVPALTGYTPLKLVAKLSALKSVTPLALNVSAEVFSRLDSVMFPPAVSVRAPTSEFVEDVEVLKISPPLTTLVVPPFNEPMFVLLSSLRLIAPVPAATDTSPKLLFG